MKKFFCAILLWQLNTPTFAEIPQKVPKKAQNCAPCHGLKGISSNPLSPNLAGQHRSYLLKQLKDFKKENLRTHPSKIPLINSLTENDMRELVKFYSEQPNLDEKPAKKFLKRGEVLYRVGDFAKQIKACIVCHGPKGNGNEEAGFPRIAGQPPSYTLKQLEDFKQGKRSNDLDETMRSISSALSQEDMEALAYYIQGLH